MMKTKLFIRMLWFLTFAFFLHSCRHDILQTNDEHYNNKSEFQLTSKKISLKESRHKDKITPILEKTTSELKKFKSLSFGKTVNYNDISINTENVIYIENGPNYHTYTFLIERNNSTGNEPLENLLLSPLPDGSYQEFLVIYNLTPQEKLQLQNGYAIDTKGKTTIIELAKGTFNGTGQLAKMVCGWTTETYWIPCSGENGHDGSNFHECPYVTNPSQGTPPQAYSVAVYKCIEEVDEHLTPDTGTGTSGGGGGGSGSGGGGSTTTECTQIPNSPQTPTLTDENGCSIGAPTLPNIPPPNSPCADLNTKSIDNSDFIGKMQELKTDANGIAEGGITTYENIPNKYGPKKYGGVDSNGASFVELDVDWSQAPNITGFMHCHLNNLNIFKNLTVFSMTDFVALAQLVENSTVAVNKLGMYVTSDRGTFAIKLTDKQSIIDFKNYIVANIGVVEKRYESKIRYEMSKKQQVKGLLDLIKDSGVGTGIELYESDSNFKNWKKHYLDDNNKVQTEKCN